MVQPVIPVALIVMAVVASSCLAAAALGVEILQPVGADTTPFEQIRSTVLNVTPTGHITDNSALTLENPFGIATFGIGGSTYAVVTSSDFNEIEKGIQILNLTDPSRITAAGNLSDTGELGLDHPRNVAVFKTGGRTYAAVAAVEAVQILDITDPANPTPTDKISDSDSRELHGAFGIAIFKNGTRTYAAVAANSDDGVQILNLTDPSQITALGHKGNDDTVKLDGPRDIAIFENGGRTYAAVAAQGDGAVQILDVTDPADPTPAGSIADGTGFALDAPEGIATFGNGTHTYAAVAAYIGDAVQILNLTDPSQITALGHKDNDSTVKLDGPRDIAIFENDGRTYAAVAVQLGDAVQILDVTDPADPTPAGSIGKGDSRKLDGAYNIAIFGSGTHTYAAVAAQTDDAVQILQLTADRLPNTRPTVDAGPARTIHEGGTFTISGATAADGDAAGTVLTYSWSAPDGSGVTFADPAVLLPAVTAPAVDSDTDVTLTLTVDDQSGTGTATATDTVVLTVRETSNHFVTTWATASDNDSITIPGTGTYAVLWGDGNTDENVDGSQTHAYADAGTHTVSITGGLTRINLGDSASDNANDAKLQSIEQWGDIGWTTMQSAFRGASNMVYNATDAPDLPEVTDMDSMFRDAAAFNGDLSSWNVSQVTTMNGMFRDADAFNGDVSSWNVSQVIGMNSTFRDADAFNGNLSSWNVSQVTGMDSMFYRAAAFNWDLSSWNVSQVTRMYGMFWSATSFNQDLSSWNVSRVTNMDFMFLGATSFDQNLGNWYVVPADTAYAASDVSLNVTTISAQNAHLDGHSPTYGIGSGGNSASFNITDANTLMFKDTPPVGNHTVIVTASGSVFENGNNWRELEITVTGEAADNTPPTITPNGANPLITQAGTTYADLGYSCTDDIDNDKDLRIHLDDSELDVNYPGTYTVTYTCTDLSGNQGTATRTVIVAGPVVIDITPTGSIDDSDGSLELRGAAGIATFKIGDDTYAAVAAAPDDGVQILNVTDPTDITATDSIDDSDGSLELNGAVGIATFKIGDNTYAAVTSNVDDGIQILDVTDPGNVIAKGSKVDGGGLELDGADGIAIFGNDTHTYAAVTGYEDSGVQILDVTDPDNVIAKGSIGDNSDRMLNGASGIATFKIGTGTYAAVAAFSDDGVQILNVTDPTDITATDSIDDSDGSLELDGASGIATFKIGTGTYAAVASSTDKGVQVLDISDPGDITPTDSITDGSSLELDGAGGIAIFGNSTHTYAAVAALFDDGVQILNVTDPAEIEAVDSINKTGGLELDGATGIATFKIGTGTYAAVAAQFDHGVQVLRLADADPDNNPPDVDAGSDLVLAEGASLMLSGNATDQDADDTLAYSWSQNPETPAVEFSNDTSPTPTITAPAVESSTVITLTLTVNDGTVDVTDEMDITVRDTAGAFITTWETTSADKEITIPGTGTYSVIWGDGTSSDDARNNVSHDYETSGTYTVSITGGLEKIRFTFPSPDAQKMQSIEQWGDIEWTTMENAFKGASNMEYRATDAPDLSRVTNMGAMFFFASEFDGNLSGWNVSGVTDMSGMFHGAGDFDGDLSGWDVSSVTKMISMFHSAGEFNKPLSGWDVSQAEDMSNMFLSARKFNQDLNDWNVSQVTDMGAMFQSAIEFNKPLSSWDVSQVTEMTNMFASTNSFRQNLGNWYVVPADTAYAASDMSLNVTTVSAQNSILDGHSFTYGIGSGGNSDLFAMDGNVLKFKATPPVGNHTVIVTVSGSLIFGSGSNWRELEITVADDTPPTITLIGDDPLTIQVGSTYAPDYTCTDDTDDDKALLLHLDDSDLNVDVPGSYTITYTCTDLSGNVGTATREVTVEDASAPFVTTWRTTGANEEITIPGTGTYNVTWGDGGFINGASGSATYMYMTPGNHTVSITGNLTSINLGANSTNAEKLQSIEQWGYIEWTTMESAFHHAANMVYNATDAPDLSGVDDMDSMFRGAASFDGDLSSWDVSQVNGMNSMFFGAAAFNQDLSEWNVSQVTDMGGMFAGASDFNGNLSLWNVSQVTNMNSMFSSASDFNQPLNDWDVSKVTDMNHMFIIAAAFNQDLSDWDVSQVTGMRDMFSGAASFNGDLSGWGVSQVTDMNAMFRGASDFNQPLNDWDVSQVTDMGSMFYRADAFNQSLSSWDVSQVDDMTTMFFGATSFEQNLGNWYVVPADTAYAASDVSLNVTTISAQNARLDGHSPTYGIGSGGNSTSFNITGTDTLMFKATPSVGSHTVNVTASGGSVFEDGNNWRMLEITVAGAGPPEGNNPPVVNAGTDQTVGEGDTVTLSGSATDPDAGDSVESYSWSAPPGITLANGSSASTTFTAPAVDAETTFTLTLTASDGTDPGSDDIAVTVKDTGSAFITTWETTSADEEITIPGTGTYSVIWGDGEFSDGVSGHVSHEYETPGTHTVSITGGLERFRLNGNSDNAPKLQSIEQWGDMEWITMRLAFWGATNMEYRATDAPDLSEVTDMSDMFVGATAFNGNLSGWDVSKVTGMTSMFDGATSFNQPLNDWNVSQVIGMNGMFSDATSFNQPLSSWDVSQVIGMGGMFSGANSFQQNLGNWYVVPADTAYATSEGTLNVTTVSAQNHILDGHSLEYGIGSGDDSALFNMTGSTLMFKATPLVGSHAVNVTASGNLFGGENNWRMLEITVAADTTTPTIALIGDDPLTIQAGTAYADPGYTCTDDTDAVGDLRLELNDSGLDVNTPGTYTVTYTCTDLSGNAGTAVRTVTVVAAGTPIDTTYPAITLNGPSTLTITAGTTYTEQGATCTDDTDGSLQVTTIGTVDASALGTHTLAYTCTDSSGNESTAIRQVRVVAAWSPEDNNPPRVNAGPDQTVGEGDTVALSGSATDPDPGDAIESYSWSAPPGSGITLADGSSASTTFTAPAVEAETTFTLTLTAGDGTDSGSDDVDVTVKETGSAFITTWRTASAGETITIPGSGTYSVIWGDGEFSDGVSGHVSHEYGTPGTHTVSITGGLGWINLGDNFANAQKLQSIEQWGGIKWVTMVRSFNGAFNMVYNADDAPDLSGVADMTGMFRRASSFNGDLSSWDVSKVTDMSGMFTSATAFDGDVSSWDVSSVTDMFIMFTSASSFNGDLSSWDVSSATGMDHMFLAANSFQQNLGNWYVVPEDTAYGISEGTLSVTTVSAQNSVLDGHSPEYGIGSGGDSALFNMTGNALMFKDAPSVGRHPVNVTASGGSVFGDGNSWRMLEIAVAGTGTDTTLPTITLYGPNPLTIQAGSTYDDPGYSCADETDAVGDLRLELNDSGLDVNTPGTYTVIYTCTDLSGNIAIAIRGVEVVAAGPPEDNNPPTITIIGDDPLTIQAGTTYDDPGYTCTDDTDPAPTVTISGTVNTSSPGTYTVTYTCTDSSDNSSTATREVTVVDTTDPVITINGSSELTITAGTTYTEQGAACTDDTDGSLQVTTSGTVDTSNPGTYTVTYACTDSSGNGSTISRTVTVVTAETPIDTTDPVITLNGPSTLTITAGTAYTDQGAACTDDTDPAPTVTISSTVDASAPGTYAVTYTCTDSSGNGSTISRTVTVVDTTDPVITLNGPSTLTITAGTAYTDQGAACTDDTDPAPTVTTSSTVDASAPGTYAVTYTCTDSSGNGSTISRTVTVVDTTDPVITLNGPSTLTITAGTAYTDQGAACTDDTDPAPTVTTSSTVDASAPGTYAVTYTCTDSSGNGSTISRTVTVVAAETPIDTTDPVITINGSSELTIQAGSTYEDAGAACTDDTDPAPTVTTSSTVDASAPGTYAVTYTCTDSSGNNATADRIVFVRAADTADDTKAPGIDITGESIVRLHVGDTYVEMGARCVDDTDGTWDAGIHKSTVNTSEVGSYIVIYECTDSSGNASLTIRHVEVAAPEKNLPPVITLNGDPEVTIQVGSTYVDAGATCTDPEDGSLEVTVRGGNPDTSSAGKRHIHYTCTDSDGETDSVVRTVTVQ